MYCIMRIVTFVITEIIIYHMISSFNIGESGSGFGLIVNFAAALIVVQIDDIPS